MTALLLAGMQVPAIAQPPARSIQFFQEEIGVQVFGDSCVLTGTYYFRNQTARAATSELLYPFPQRAGLPEPARVEVTDASTNTGVTIRRGTRCILFSISVPPWGESAYRVWYVQPTPMKKMEYLLTTGRRWGRPLEHATFSVRMPDSLRLTSVSIPHDTLWRSPGATNYASRKRQFFADRELTITWQRR
jgi:hypothetical protein